MQTRHTVLAMDADGNPISYDDLSPHEQRLIDMLGIGELLTGEPVDVDDLSDEMRERLDGGFAGMFDDEQSAHTSFGATPGGRFGFTGRPLDASTLRDLMGSIPRDPSFAVHRDGSLSVSDGKGRPIDFTRDELPDSVIDALIAAREAAEVASHDAHARSRAISADLAREKAEKARQHLVGYRPNPKASDLTQSIEDIDGLVSSTQMPEQVYHALCVTAYTLIREQRSAMEASELRKEEDRRRSDANHIRWDVIHNADEHELAWLVNNATYIFTDYWLDARQVADSRRLYAEHRAGQQQTAQAVNYLLDQPEKVRAWIITHHPSVFSPPTGSGQVLSMEYAEELVAAAERVLEFEGSEVDDQVPQHMD